MDGSQLTAGETPHDSSGVVDVCAGNHPPAPAVQGEFARDVETKLYCNFLNQELFDDDRVTPDYYPLPYDTHFTLFNIPIKKHNSVGSVGHEFISVVEDLEDDYVKLQATDYGVDMESTMLKKQALEEAFGDILPVRVQMDCLYSVPTQMIVHFMKMENMMFNIYDYPELFKEMMNRIADDTLAYYRMLEEKHLILPTTGGESLGQGSWCYNRELRVKKKQKYVHLQRGTSGDSWIPRRL